MFAVTLVASTIGLVLVDGVVAEVVVLLVVWGLAGLFRFTVLRRWVYPRRGADRRR